MKLPKTFRSRPDNSNKEAELKACQKRVQECESQIIQFEDKIFAMNEQLSAFSSGAREAVRLQREVEALSVSLQQEQESKRKCKV